MFCVDVECRGGHLVPAAEASSAFRVVFSNLHSTAPPNSHKAESLHTRSYTLIMVSAKCVYPQSQCACSLLTTPSVRLHDPAPFDYATPPFPSLYWPLRAKPGVANYLYYAGDIWRYTLLWTLIVFAVFHLGVAGFAVLMQFGKGKHAWQYVWIIPLFYALVAGVEVLLAGSIVGLMSVFSISIASLDSSANITQ